IWSFMNQGVQVHLFYPRIITFGGRGIRDPLIYSQLSSDLWAVRLEDGDDILMNLRRFVEVKRIRARLLEGIGSLKKVRLGYYDFETRKYSWKAIEEDMEVVNVFGTVSR